MPDIKRKYDLTEGAILGKVLKYSIPLILSGMLQLLYNATDMIVVGQFAADKETALSAVGSCGALINLIINLFMGLSVGAGVCVAQDYGAKQYDEVRKTVHTAVPLSVILGIVVSVFGFLTAEPLLRLTGVKEDILAQAAPYMRAYMVGMPASMVYNYCATMLRSVGDTAHPLVFLSVSGLVNVGLNVVMVLVFGLEALGVGIATAASTWMSVIMIVIFMLRSKDCMHLEISGCHMDKGKLARIVRIGIPAGLQGCVFSLSNVMIQSAVNGFEKPSIAGNTAASNIDAFIYNAMNALYHATLTFVGQNVGAHRYDRVRKIVFTCACTSASVGICLSVIAILFGRSLLSLYAPGNDAAINAGMIRLYIVGGTYFLCGLMEVGCGAMRGMGSSVVPMVVSLIGSCVMRIIWIYTIFRLDPTPEMLYISYPISWLITLSTHFICSEIQLRRIKRKYECGQEKGQEIPAAK